MQHIEAVVAAATGALRFGPLSSSTVNSSKPGLDVTFPVSFDPAPELRNLTQNGTDLAQGDGGAEGGEVTAVCVQHWQMRIWWTPTSANAQELATQGGADAMNVRGEVASASFPYQSRTEIGPWLEAGRKLEPCEVQFHLQERNRSSRSHHPYCIYVHVPFCPSRCSYCALYTLAPHNNIKETLNEYLVLTRKAITSHPNAFPARPPTTVHFGGGTPLFLGIDRFASLTTTVRETFGNSQTCEWALETNTSSLTPEVSSILKKLGFQRVHLGIQTLDNNLRRKIRRRESGKAALEKIDLLRQLDFRISVDLILGFEGQSDLLLGADLERLYRSGVRMFSICELRNLNQGIRTTQAAARNYRLWCRLWDFMMEHNLIPIHLGQFGRSYKDNLYYTHPARGEDCISLGPYAHGSDGPVLYANQLLPAYYDSARANRPPIRFGVLYNRNVQSIRRLERELLGHRIRLATVQHIMSRSHTKFCPLWDSWLEAGLLEFQTETKCFRPTRDGSWYVGNMVADLRRLVSIHK